MSVKEFKPQYLLVKVEFQEHLDRIYSIVGSNNICTLSPTDMTEGLKYRIQMLHESLHTMREIFGMPTEE